jgi:hypothetical protein
MNIRVPSNVGSFLTTWETVSFSRRKLVNKRHWSWPRFLHSRNQGTCAPLPFSQTTPCFHPTVTPRSYIDSKKYHMMCAAFPWRLVIYKKKKHGGRTKFNQSNLSSARPIDRPAIYRCHVICLQIGACLSDSKPAALGYAVATITNPHSNLGVNTALRVVPPHSHLLHSRLQRNPYTVAPGRQAQIEGGG